MGISQLSWLIPALPTFAFIIIGLLGHRMKAGGGYVAIGFALGALVVSALVFIEVLTGVDLTTRQSISLPIEISGTWIQFNKITLEVGLLIDQLAAVMVLVVSFVSALIVIYSLGYMAREEGLPRYYSTISLFIASMLGLVLANNFLQLYIFWELVGLCSYLLIGFWYKKPSAAAAAKKAFIVTRVGDVLLLVGIIIVFNFFGTFNFLQLTAKMNNFDPRFLGSLTLTTALIFGGAQGKSAQFPLHMWLPDAMEGPTTVSALIHAATMVKAGVYLVARSYPLFTATPDTLLYVAAIGTFTAFIAATMAMVQTDMKRIIAYSTISQIGLMMMALGVGGAGYTAGIFHLMNHAFFKALLFLAAGSVLHATMLLDIRKMGGLGKTMRITSITMFIGALANSGIPPFNGFFSKDEVLLVTFDAAAVNPVYSVLFVIGLLTTFATAIYSFRLWFLIFTGKPRSELHPHESPKIMWVPLTILAGLASVAGFTLFINGGFGSFLFYLEPEPPTFNVLVAGVSSLVAVLGVLTAYFMYYRQSVSSLEFRSGRFGGALHYTVAHKYGMDHLYYWVAERVFYNFTRGIDWFDRLGIDGIVNGMSSLAYGSGRRIRKLQNGIVSNYATAIAIGMIALMIYVLLVRL